jgi:hypothetical protein
MNNLRELMNYDNDEIRRKRINKLKKVDYFYRFKGIITPPSSVTLFQMQINYIHTYNDYKIEGMRKKFNEQLEIVSGIDLLRDLNEHTILLHEISNKNIVGNFFTSVPTQLYDEEKDPKNIRIKDLEIDISREEFENRKMTIKEKLKNKGDKKKIKHLDGVDELLDPFYEKMINIGTDSKLEFFAKLANVPIDEISEDTTFYELTEKMEYYKKIRNVAEELGINFDDVKHLTIPEIPTLLFEKLFKEEYDKQIIIDKPRRAEASIIQDKYLSTFSIFCKVIVDSRTAQVLKKIEKKLPYEIDYVVNNI